MARRRGPRLRGGHGREAVICAQSPAAQQLGHHVSSERGMGAVRHRDNKPTCPSSTGEAEPIAVAAVQMSGAEWCRAALSGALKMESCCVTKTSAEASPTACLTRWQPLLPRKTAFPTSALVYKIAVHYVASQSRAPVLVQASGTEEVSLSQSFPHLPFATDGCCLRHHRTAVWCQQSRRSTCCAASAASLSGSLLQFY